MVSTTLEEILISVANNAVNQQRDDGSLPAGCNGPHKDSETPVRNTSHYLLLFSNLYQKKGDERYAEAARGAANYLNSTEARPHDATFYHRDSEYKDRCNGIIGQAWTIEAIAEAGLVLDTPELIQTAEEVFLLHPFNERLGLWKRVETDGKNLHYDSTFNHQLWFAAAGALLAEYHNVDPDIKQQVSRFLDAVDSNVNVAESGCVGILARPPVHFYPYAALTDKRARMGAVLMASKFPFKDNDLVRDVITSYTPVNRLPPKSEESREKEIGYQSFHLYGFAILKEIYPNHSLWDNDWVRQMFDCIEEDSFITSLVNNRYGYPYNVSGLEIAYALEIFGRGDRDVQQEWIQRQFETCWSQEASRMDRNNPDPETLTARMYEIVRLSDWTIEVSV